MTRMPEAAALERWCPFAWVSDVGNRDKEGADSWCKCLGAACMAWRWADPLPLPPHQNRRRGYCGVAGKP